MTPTDRLIDDVARAMTEVATPDLRSHTLSRIAGARRGLRWGRLVPVPAIAALAIVGALLLRAPVTRPRVEEPTHVSSQTETRTEPSVSPHASVKSRSPMSVPAPPSIWEQRWTARRLARVPMPAPLTPDNIQPAPIAVPLLQLKPLMTESLTLEQLPSGG